MPQEVYSSLHYLSRHGYTFLLLINIYIYIYIYIQVKKVSIYIYIYIYIYKIVVENEDGQLRAKENIYSKNS